MENEDFSNHERKMSSIGLRNLSSNSAIYMNVVNITQSGIYENG